MYLSKRGDIYYLWYKDTDTGKKSKVSTRCRTKEDAKRFFHSFDTIKKEKRKRVLKYSFSQFREEYLVYAASIHTRKTYLCDEVSLDQFLRFTGDMMLRDIGVREVERFIAYKQKETSAWNAKKYYGHLASAFQRAVVWKKIDNNPFRSVKKPKPAEKLPAYFSKEQLGILLKSIEDPDFRDLVLFAVMTGMRMSEILNVQWEQVDLDRKIILVKNTSNFTTKSKRNRNVPMNDGLALILTRRKQNASCPLVFHRDNQPHTVDNVTKRFKQYVRASNLDDALHFHSLRHTTASLLVQAGVSIYNVKEILGHSQIATTLIYTHLTESHLKESVNQISLPPDMFD